MHKYPIWVVSPPGYIHSACFIEQAQALRDAFIALGYESEVVRADPPEGKCIVMGGHLLPENYYNPNHIFYNLEQVAPGTAWFNFDYMRLLKKHRVLDYSPDNIKGLKLLEIDATLLKIGYMPCLTRIERAPDPNIDVLFYGSVNERRKKLLESLISSGLMVVSLFGIYGADRDDYTRRAKLVLNMHYYDAKVWEITRCMDLFANAIPVVSEYGHGCEEFKDAALFGEYGELVEKCHEALKNPDPIGKRGFEVFSKMNQVDYLKEALCLLGD